MTAHTTKRTCRRVVIEWLRCGHFITADAMTGFATQTVLFVTESDFECSGHLVWARVAADFMAHAAGRDIAIACLRAWTVTSKTSRVCVEADRDRQSHAAASGSMAASAI